MNEWEWKQKPLTVALYIHILLNANHQDAHWQGIVIKRGQYLTGRKKLSLNTGLSEQQVRTALNHLKSTNEVTTTTTMNYSIITVTNYNAYQDSNQAITKQQPSDNQAITTNKNDNKEKKEKKSIIGESYEDDFEQFWKDWKPFEISKGNKQVACKKYKAARAKSPKEQINKGRDDYIEFCHHTECKTQHISTWLHNNGWEFEKPVNIPKKGKDNGKQSVEDVLREWREEQEHDSGNGHAMLPNS